ncbi:NUDIX hydrolase [Nocardia jejuensis]|uniref:NUDIX hydrolase n=1 Tax=Nocardia jejuensis TaxID=328049 RepID=UPI001FE10C05|nr:NUDIX domain-containing protein [Nocardia jejuensis]
MNTQSKPGEVAKPLRHTLIGDVHLMLRRGDELLFGRRHNTGFEDGAWHLPSGHLEVDESMVTALVREAAEEIGVRIAPHDVAFSHVMHNSSAGGRIAFFFAVHNWQGEPINLEQDKCSELAWFQLDSLPAHMIPYCRTALEYVQSGQPFSTYGWQ